MIHTEWDVLLAANTEEVEWDFKITGEFSKRSIKVFHKQNPSAAIAEMSQHDKVVKVRLANDAFRMTISSNIDFAFVASLISIFHQSQQRKNARKEGMQTAANEIGQVAVDLGTSIAGAATSQSQ
ncbi:protein LURP-one-related 15-like [Dioscorea cayenensis subsp. rotundata]|uniref:Protein LURP-one-related 15-like n=1 Tax=Dioscorea cayennensis subsp. rotundata TaxID=55577 RepID=A0AB40CAB0_DIOCR|nr:protein LURP-one-related 15-like [Dioscorea cayenensis subsp. rotundata]